MTRADVCMMRFVTYGRGEEVGRTSGEGLEGIAAAVGKLSRSMLQAQDPTSAAAQALKAINFTWKDLQGLSPDEQLTNAKPRTPTGLRTSSPN